MNEFLNRDEMKYVKPSTRNSWKNAYQNNTPSEEDAEDAKKILDATYFLVSEAMAAEHYDMLSCDSRGRMYDGNTTFPVLLYFLEHSQYNYYWRIEYDVRYGGNWKDFFKTWNDNDADLLTTTLTYHKDRLNWRWWKTMRKPWWTWRKMPLIRSFLPVCRLSQRACKQLHAAYCKGGN